jgi:PAS domain S-box-containing protein
MFNLEQFPIHLQFTIVNSNQYVETILENLSFGTAVLISFQNKAYLFTPEEFWLFRNQSVTISEFLSDKSNLISLSLPLPNHAEDLIKHVDDISFQSQRPIVFHENGEPVGYSYLSELLKFSFTEQYHLGSYFFALSETVTDAVTVVDRNGTVICWNTQAEEMYGIPKKDILGRRIGEHFEPAALMVLKILDEGRTLRKTYHTPRPNKHVLINASPIFEKGGRIIGSIAAEQDITQLVRLNEELSSAHDFKPEDKLQIEDPFSIINGRSKKIENAINIVKKVVSTDRPLLLIGEPGAGKERFAQVIHYASGHSVQQFFSVNCGAVPEGFLEAELFGYQGGVFTGNEMGKPGKLELANNGTLFLEEIDKLPMDIQAKLYQYIQNHFIIRFGGGSPVPLKTRIIAATDKNLHQMVQDGLFRSDLYYAISVVSIEIPPLRERKEDIPEIVQSYLREFAAQYQKPIPLLTPEVMLALMNYDWPGNLRELRNVIERCVIICENNRISLDNLPIALQKEQPQLELATEKESEMILKPKINPVEEVHIIEEALRKTLGNKSAAAKLLGISRGTLYNKMREYNLS